MFLQFIYLFKKKRENGRKKMRGQVTCPNYRCRSLAPPVQAETGDFLRSTGGRFGRQVHAGPPTKQQVTNILFFLSLFFSMYLTLDSIRIFQFDVIELNFGVWMQLNSIEVKSSKRKKWEERSVETGAGPADSLAGALGSADRRQGRRPGALVSRPLAALDPK